MRYVFWWKIGLLIVIPLIVYIPILQAKFVFDDRTYVLENQSLKNFEGLKTIWLDIDASPQYYPLVFTSYWVEFHLWGLNSLGYHFVNILGHIITTVLLWQFLKRLGISGAWIAALIFAIHPVQVESLACISERKNILSGLFYLSSLLAYFRFWTLKKDETVSNKVWLYYGLSLCFFLCALLSKTVAATFPAVIIILLYWKYGPINWKDAANLIPFFILSLILCIVTLWVENKHFNIPAHRLPQSFLEQILIAGRAIWFYLSKLFWPQNLCFIYPRWDVDVKLWWQYLFPVSAAGVIILTWLTRRRIGTGPLVAVLFYIVTLLPTLGFIKFGFMGLSYVADHFQYLACIGPITLTCAMLKNFLRKHALMNKSIFLIVPAILIVLATLSWRRGRVYNNIELLWQDTTRKNSEIWTAHYNLATILTSKGSFKEAIKHYNKALQLNPKSAAVYVNLGTTLLQIRQTQLAIHHFEQAIRIKPNHAIAHFNMGNIWLAKKKYDKAINKYDKVLQIKPDYIKAHMNRALALDAKGQTDEAIRSLKQTIELKPSFSYLHYNLAGIYAKVGKIEDAIKTYQRGITLKPADVGAHCKLGILLRNQGNFEKAVKQFKTALSIDPNYHKAHRELSNTLSKQKSELLKKSISNEP